MTEPLKRRLARSARQVADQNKQHLADLPRSWFLAVVTTIVPGGASDGAFLVSVTYRGTESVVNGYLSSYTPAVGHRVPCLRIDNQIFVAPNIVGTP